MGEESADDAPVALKEQCARSLTSSGSYDITDASHHRTRQSSYDAGKIRAQNKLQGKKSCIIAQVNDHGLEASACKWYVFAGLYPSSCRPIGRVHKHGAFGTSIQVCSLS